MKFRLNSENKDSILQKLITWTSIKTDKLTDFNPGSAVRTLLEAVSLQIEEFYYNLFNAIKYAVRNACYNAFKFEKYASSYASGTVTIYYEDPILQDKVIKKGTEFHTGENTLRKIYFKSTKDILIKEGAQAVIVPVECTEKGTIGNVTAGEISKLSIGNPNIYLISNNNDFSNGKDIESDTEREQRFREYVHTLQRGTKDAVAYGIKQVNGVAGVYIDDNYIGYLIAYVHDIYGNLTDELKQEVLKEVEGYRSAGIEVVVRPTVKKVVDLDIKVVYRPGYDPNVYNQAIEKIIYQYINNLKVSEDLNISTLITVINDNFREIIAYIDLEDKKDIVTLNNEILKPGEIVVSD
ncbi:baseplate J/gp47 family protein [Peptoniphilus sp. MSJ-1]|uniref:Baseplate J/gp47 family protein n=1 Tax=Peptoniphilus ovalis TaxID=2841503 RepID=A0ABS6FH53_9FIRM|nr:baseplate J/gp47 family protein [Peptoniphilus ovalis]MBU5669501.1 baseplate J/gp47 family protein [Peptoniphilus ovalis]